MIRHTSNDIATALTEQRNIRIKLQTLNQIAPNRRLAVATTQAETSELFLQALWQDTLDAEKETPFQ